MPIFTGTDLTWLPSMTNTTSTGFCFSSAFLSGLVALVPAFAVMELVGVIEANELVGTELVFAAPASFFTLSRRVVTLAMGAPMALVRVRVSIVALMDMPGRNWSPSVSRMRTWNWVAVWPDDELLELP